MSIEENESPVSLYVRDADDTPPAAPAWMASQAPKVTITKVDGGTGINGGAGGTLATLPPKMRKPRRTKAQMLADAQARLGVESVIPCEVAITPRGYAPQIAGTVHGEPVWLKDDHTVASREDTAHAVARDLSRFPGHTTTTDRLAIVACILALLALSVAIVALVR